MQSILWGLILGVILGAALIFIWETVARAVRNARHRRLARLQKVVDAAVLRQLKQRELAAFWEKSPETDQEWDRYEGLMIEIGLN